MTFHILKGLLLNLTISLDIYRVLWRCLRMEPEKLQ